MAALAANTRQEVKEAREEQKQHHQTQMSALDHIRDRVDEQGTRYMQAKIGEEQEASLKWLTSINYAAQHSDFLKRRQLGTGQWLLDSAEFKAWVGTPKQVLFCPGIPGAGKTILTSIVIDHLRSLFDGNPKVGIAYLYYNFRGKDAQKAEDLISSLLVQLTRGLPCFPAAVECLYAGRKADQTGPLLDELVKTLCSVAELYEERVFIAVDALDECHESDGSRFLAKLLNLQSSTRSKVNIFATREDIQQYLEGHMDELGPEIIDGILDAADGMFPLVERFFQALADTITITEMRKVLAQLQKKCDVSNKDHKLRVLRLAYDQAMERINDQRPGHQRLAKHVLSWITHSERPLTPLELRHAWAVKDSEDELDEESLPGTDDLVAVCAGLVTIDDMSGIIRGLCTTHKEYEERLRSNPLFEYAARNWFRHARDASTGCEEVVNLLRSEAHLAAVDQFWDDPKEWNWSGGIYHFNRGRPCNRKSPPGGLHKAAYYGLAHAVKSLIKTGQLDEKDWRGYTPLGHAAKNGHEEVVRCSWRRAVSTSMLATGMWGTPLAFAASNGHAAVVRMLQIMGKADVNARDAYGATPLSLAMQEEHEDVVNLLLATDIVQSPVVKSQAAEIVNWKDRWGCTALTIAVQANRYAMVEAFLALGEVDVNARDKKGWTPLRHAHAEEFETGESAIVQLLIAHGAHE
ncbi:hypothetical protein C8A01DRAFT_48998 [Parachaetomium inaequale]|uniref:NACHT domain-containing protein n=1 Tax=Parachaetomium inaequale TaxID=2588326 RepID=A0AAN6SPC6_9PEZI|nr:hypothetical protein C8A01DRAFT_48998 [Parachaetomium inaequale]